MDQLHTHKALLLIAGSRQCPLTNEEQPHREPRKLRKTTIGDHTHKDPGRDKAPRIGAQPRKYGARKGKEKGWHPSGRRSCFLSVLHDANEDAKTYLRLYVFAHRLAAHTPRRTTMAAKVMSFLCEKGGSGKSTGSTNFASYLAKLGKRVLIVDHDPQASSSTWSQFRKDHAGPGEIVVITMKTLQRDLRSISSGFDYVIIDGQPTTDKVTVEAIKVSELVIIPVHPSGFDVWAGINTAGLILDRQALTDGEPKAKILISQAIVGTTIARDIQEALDSYQLPLMENRTHIRVAYTEVSSVGLSAFDLRPKAKARVEMEKVCQEILELLG